MGSRVQILPSQPARYPDRSYVEMDGDPVYSFGFGLSYSSFAYSKLRVEPEVVPVGGIAHVSVDVTNVGKVAGEEVVQLYIRDDLASVARPPKQL